LAGFFAAAFFWAAHRFRRASAIFLLEAALTVRRPLVAFVAGFATCLRLAAQRAFAAPEICLRPAALIRRRPPSFGAAVVGGACQTTSTSQLFECRNHSLKHG
jgi:hypothetical protein